VRRAAAALLLAAGLATAAPAGLIRDRIYPADQGWPDEPAWIAPAPQAVRYATADGLTLSSWYWPGDSKRLLIFFHGNAGNQTIAAHYVEPLRAGGDALLVASYRGYGGNPGKPSEAGLFADGAAILAQAHALGFTDDRIVLVGYSLGAAVALHLGTQEKVAGVITIGAFTTLPAVAPKAVGFLIPDRYDNVASIARLQAPVVLFHGSQDDVVPYKLGQTLYAAARVPKRFVTMNGAPHRVPMEMLAPYLLKAADAIRAGDLQKLDFADR
jgi:uncharacterized protein